MQNVVVLGSKCSIATSCSDAGVFLLEGQAGRGYGMPKIQSSEGCIHVNP